MKRLRYGATIFVIVLTINVSAHLAGTNASAHDKTKIFMIISMWTYSMIAIFMLIRSQMMEQSCQWLFCAGFYLELYR